LTEAVKGLDPQSTAREALRLYLESFPPKIKG